MKLYTKDELKKSRIFFDKHPPNFLSVLITATAFILIISLVISNYTHKNYIVRGQGEVMDKNLHFISIKNSGVINQILKPEGSDVKEGQILFVVSSGEEGLQQQIYETQLNEQKEKLEILNRYKKSLNEKVNYMQNIGPEQEYYGKMEYYLFQVNIDRQNEISIQEEITSKKEKRENLLKRQKYIELDIDILTQKTQENPQLKSELEEKKNNISDIELEIKEIDDELKQLEKSLSSSSQSQQIYFQLVSDLGINYSTVQKSISDLEANSDVNKKKDENYTVVASSEGKVHYQIPVKVGMSVQEGQTIAEISNMDQNNFYVESFVAATDISKIKENQEVDVSIVGVNSQKFGTLKGKIVKIDKGTTVQQTQQGNFNMYKLDVALETKQLKSKNETIDLVLSMPVETRIIYDRETYLDWMLEMLNFK